MSRPDMTMQKAEALVAKAVSEVEAYEAYDRYEAFDVNEWRRARAARIRHERTMIETADGIAFRMS